MWRQGSRALLGLAVVGGLLTAGSVRAQTIVTPDDPQGWRQHQVQGSGSAAITGTQARSGDGSVELRTTQTNDRAWWMLGTDAFFGGTSLGRFDQVTALSFDWFRSSLSTAGNHLTPALRLHLRSGSLGAPLQLVWEGTYNGLNPAPVDEWVFSDILNARFHTGGGADMQPLSYWMGEYGSRNVMGISVGVGSGWSGEFVGFADNVTLGFNGQDPTTWNFNLTNTPQQVVPEPMSMALLGTGLAGLAAARRRRRRVEDETTV